MLFLNATNRTDITMRNETLVIPFGDILIYKDFAEALLLKELGCSRNPIEPLNEFQFNIQHIARNNSDAYLLQYLVNRLNHTRIFPVDPRIDNKFIYAKSPVTLIYEELAKWTSQTAMEKIIILVQDDHEFMAVNHMQGTIYNGHKIQAVQKSIYQFLHEAPHEGINWTGIILKNIHMINDIVTKNNFDLKLKTILCAQLGGNVIFNKDFNKYICPYDMVELSIAKEFEFGYIPLFNFDEKAFVNG